VCRVPLAFVYRRRPHRSLHSSKIRVATERPQERSVVINPSRIALIEGEMQPNRNYTKKKGIKNSSSSSSNRLSYSVLYIFRMTMVSYGSIDLRIESSKNDLIPVKW
jgi:hypothetical protein